jgi:hypothetical protein
MINIGRHAKRQTVSIFIIKKDYRIYHLQFHNQKNKKYRKKCSSLLSVYGKKKIATVPLIAPYTFMDAPPL